MIKNNEQINSYAGEIAKYIVKSCLDNNYFIDTLKLEYLMILADGYMLVKYQRKLFNEEIILINKGFKIKSIDEEFKRYNIGFDKDINLTYHLPLLSNEEEIIYFVCKTYGEYTIDSLNKLSIFQRLIQDYNFEKEFIIPNREFINYFKAFYIEEENKLNDYLNLKLTRKYYYKKNSL